MVLAREGLPLTELTDPPPQREIFPRVQLRLAPIENDVALADVCHPSQPGCVESTSDRHQTTGRSVGGIHLSSIAPTSKLSEFVSNRFVVFVSSATLLLLAQFLVCCIDRFNPRPQAGAAEWQLVGSRKPIDESHIKLTLNWPRSIQLTPKT